EQVVDMRVDRPRRFPVGTAVSAEVRREDVEPIRQPLLRKLAEPSAVCVDAVDAHHRRRARVTPLVQLQLHYCNAPASAGIAASQWMIAPTSAADSIGASPWFTAAITFAFTNPVSSSVSPGTPTATSRLGATWRP